jgi:hypothetical protein
MIISSTPVTPMIRGNARSDEKSVRRRPKASSVATNLMLNVLAVAAKRRDRDAGGAIEDRVKGAVGLGPHAIGAMGAMGRTRQGRGFMRKEIELGIEVDLRV